MKYYSELTKKTYETEDECVAAEKAFQEEEAHKKELANAASKEKKELVKNIDAAEANLSDAYKEYAKAKEKVKSIYAAAEKEAAEILNTAKKGVQDAEIAKCKAIKEFNSKYGAYTKSYSGEEALKELERSISWIDNIFGGMFF